MNNKLGLYIHIPYCEYKCDYCIYKVTEDMSTVDKYFKKLNKEIIYRLKNKNANKYINTIHIGGGSPSYVDSKYIRQLLDTVRSVFNIDKNTEIAIETNPKDITTEKVKDYLDMGINRIVLGIQSINPDYLDSLGRIDTVEDIKNSLKILKDLGVPSVGADLIRDDVGISDLKNGIELCSDWGVDHISIYDSDSTSEDQYKKSLKWTEDNGYLQYHVTSFAREGCESQYSKAYWTGGEYLGVGLSASGSIGDLRYTNDPEDVDDYIYSDYDDMTLDFYNTLEDSINEVIFMGIGYIPGIDISKIKEKYDVDLLEYYRDAIKKHVDLGNIVVTEDKIKITETGQLSIDQIEDDFYK